MPNIRTVNNPIDQITPNTRGSQAFEMEGRHVSAAYSAVAQSERRLGETIGSTATELGQQYQQHLARQEISHGAASMSDLFASMTDDWNQTAKSADPNDPTTAQRWREQQDQKFQDFADSFQTKQGKMWAQEQVNSLRQHFFEKTAADQATMAGNAAHDNILRLTNNLTHTVMQDPSTADTALGVADSAIDAIVKADPRLTADQASAMRTQLLSGIKSQIAKGAVIGAADQNPDAADAMLASGKFASYLDVGDAKALAGYSKSQREAAERDARLQAEWQDKAQKDAAHQEEKKLYAAGLQGDGTWMPPPGFNKRLQQVAAMPGSSLAEVHEFAQAAKTFTEDAINGTTTASSPAVFNDMVHRMSLDPSDPNALSKTEIYQAAAARQLSNHDTQLLVNGLDKGDDPAERHLQKGLETFIQSQKPLIVGDQLMGTSPEGVQRFYEFRVAMEQAVASARRSNPSLSPAQVEDLLLNPASQSYIGKMDSRWMRYYTKSAGGGDDLLSNIPSGGAAPAATPNAAPTAAQPKKGPSDADVAKVLFGG